MITSMIGSKVNNQKFIYPFKGFVIENLDQFVIADAEGNHYWVNSKQALIWTRERGVTIFGNNFQIAFSFVKDISNTFKFAQDLIVDKEIIWRTN